jgi:alkanesulfonate monooxygenase SsuD/methylene tetrahydromethanopterin reductase-like flavin-dependent oxidoreductase (luciferase family)
MDEALQLFRHLFSGSREPFKGRYYAYDDGVFDPLPVKREKLPILLGGNSEPAIRRAARMADGWESTGMEPEAWKRCADQLREWAGDRQVEAGARISLSGGAREMLEQVRRWRDAGADHLMLGLGFTDGFADRMRLFAREVRPSL